MLLLHMPIVDDLLDDSELILDKHLLDDEWECLRQKEIDFFLVEF